MCPEVCKINFKKNKLVSAVLAYPFLICAVVTGNTARSFLIAKLLGLQNNDSPCKRLL